MSNHVSVTVSANSSPFSAGLAKVENSLDHFKHHASEQFSEFGKEMLGAFALGAIVEGIKGLFEEFSKVQDLAERMGTSAESLQRMGQVAKASGVDTEALVKTLQKGTKNAVEAIAGNEELADAFEKLGVEAKEFVNATPEEQLIQLAEGYEHSGQNAESLNAILKALGKSGADIIPILRKGPEALKEEMEAASVASNETVATMKEVTEKFEKLWNAVKSSAADALGFIVKRVEALGTGIAMIVAYVGHLKDGFSEAAKAADEVLQAAADLQLEKEEKQKEEAQHHKPVDTEALEVAKQHAEQEKKEAEELSKLKDENAKKEDEALLRSMSLVGKRAELEERLAAVGEEKPKNALETEQAKGKKLDLEKELESLNKEIAKEDERKGKEREEEAKKQAREELEEKKGELKDAESTLTKLSKEHSLSVDSLRQIGGGIANANYSIAAQKDDLQRQQVDYQRQTVEQLKQVVGKLQEESGIVSYDGSFE